MKLPAVLRARGWLIVLAALLGVTAAVLPPVARMDRVFEQMIVFDITQSMNVIDQSLDGKPVSRLDFGRSAVIQAIARMPCGSRVGLGVFAKRRTLMLLSPIEVCANLFELTQAIERVDGRMAWDQGSQVSRGLYSAIGGLGEYSRAPSLLFITDGHESPPLDGGPPPFDTPVMPVAGMLLGVGGATPVPIPRTDREGRPAGWWSADMVVQRPDTPGKAPSQEHLSSLRESHLQDLSRVTGLGYRRLDSLQVMQQAMSAPALARRQLVDADLRWLPALLAGMLLIAFYLPPPSGRLWLALSRLRNRAVADGAAGMAARATRASA